MSTRKELMRMAKEKAKKDREHVLRIEKELREKQKKEEEAKREIA